MGKLDKWVRGAIPALLIHGSIGSVYAWSLFVNPISQHIGVSTSSVQFTFSLAIFFLGMSAAFGGNIVEKNIHRSSLISLIFFCGGLLTTAFAISIKSLLLIYIGYGCLMGIGLGIGYITPVKTLMLWFKDHKGLATGLAVMGFGAASSIASPIITFLLNKYSLWLTFIILSAIYFIPLLIAHFIIKKPSWFKETIEKSDFKVLSMFKNKAFIKIWFMIFINITCGLALISIASPLLNEMNCSKATIAVVISIMGLCNGLGRLVFSAFSDKLKNRAYIYLIIFIISVITIGLSILCKSFIVPIAITLCIISSTYGAGFSNLPTLLSDKYGMKNISKIHGLSLTAWAIAGLCGNQLSSFIQYQTGSYKNVLIVLIIAYLIGGCISFNLIKKGNKGYE